MWHLVVLLSSFMVLVTPRNTPMKLPTWCAIEELAQSRKVCVSPWWQSFESSSWFLCMSFILLRKTTPMWCPLFHVAGRNVSISSWRFAKARLLLLESDFLVPFTCGLLKSSLYLCLFAAFNHSTPKLGRFSKVYLWQGKIWCVWRWNCNRASVSHRCCRARMCLPTCCSCPWVVYSVYSLE